MRIDQNYGPQAVPETERSTQSNAAAASSSATSTSGAANTEDQAHLSGALAQVQALMAHAAQLPEVREEKVQALRQTVLKGQYNPGAQNVAGAMLSYMTLEPA